MDERFDVYLYNFESSDLVIKISDVDRDTMNQIVETHWNAGQANDAWAVPTGEEPHDVIDSGQTVTVMTFDEWMDSQFKGEED